MAEVVSTINKAGEDYASLTLWEDAKDGNLVSAELQQTAELYVEDGALDDRVAINGSTTSSDYYMKITVPSADRHEGVWSDSKSRIVPTSDGAVIAVNDNYVTIEWLQIYPRGSSVSSAAIELHSANGTVKHCIIDGHKSTNTAGIYMLAANCVAYRNIIYHCDEDWAAAIYCDISDTGRVAAYNTIYGGTSAEYSHGIRERSGSNPVDVVGNVIFNCGYNFSTDSSWGGGSGYNCTEDGTAPGSNNQVSKTDTDQFTSLTDGSENFHLKSGADCINNGGATGASTYNIDIDGDTVTATADIGADEYVAAGTPLAEEATPVFIFGGD